MDTLRSWLSCTYLQKQKHRQLKLSQSEREQLMSAPEIECCICGANVDHGLRVVHHCHLTGFVFLVAHSEYNLKARSVNFLPVFIHNLSRYDSHHIIKNLLLKEHEKLLFQEPTKFLFRFRLQFPWAPTQQRKVKLLKFPTL